MRDRIDRGDVLLARLRHQGDEPLVLVIDALLQHCAGGVAHRPQRAEFAGQLGGADTVDVHAEPLERPLERREHRENADRTGQRDRARDDAVGVHRDVVAARCRERAHRRHDRLAIGPELGDLATDDLGGERAAAGTVDAQHDGLHVVVETRLAQLRRQRVGADRAGGLFTGQDFARCDYHGDLVVRLRR